MTKSETSKENSGTQTGLPTTSYLGEVLELCRKHGVHHIVLGNISIDLAILAKTHERQDFYAQQPKVDESFVEWASGGIIPPKREDLIG